MHHGTIDELDPAALQLAAAKERQRERQAVESAAISLRRSHAPDEARRLIGDLLTIVELADKHAYDEARAAALEAIREPRWRSAETAHRFQDEVDAFTAVSALCSRPLGEWPGAVLDPLGLSAENAAVA